MKSNTRNVKYGYKRSLYVILVGVNIMEFIKVISSHLDIFTPSAS